ncbi:MAG: isoprenylcysteine carboxylmethyltransferase family protein [Candidatus Lustribacter sp.]|jgi:protein-S-isoprenylcysteine O-methyltransferase Ste14
MIESNELDEFVFARRGELLAVPAVVLAALGRPSAFSIAVGLPLAFTGEAIRAWAVGYSGVTTRGDTVTAPSLVTAGPYAYVRNPLYAGNFVTALGFAIAFTGANSGLARSLLVAGALGTMIGVYSVVIPHEERFLRDRFGAEFDEYVAAVPRLVPRTAPAGSERGSYDPSVIARAESRTFATFGAMLVALAFKALKA